ncbi:MAG TPA: SPOR domain-containing protein [Candidatus Acidoferrales bacterium]|nr:SPOR domain-containing protein [Candidatus Acidoferrales bacterium]
MANGSKGNDVVLESRHLIGLFVVIVVIFGVVFSLGYELGRNQVGTHVQAAAAPPDSDATAPEPALKPEVITNPASSAAMSSAKPQTGGDKIGSQPAAPASDWDFYKSADSNPPPAHLEKPAKTERVSSAASQPTATQPKTTIHSARTKPVPILAPVKTTKSPSMDAPLLPHGSILLQVAALTRQSDALSMAQVLHQKHFSAIVVPPGTDHYYHVQVGPYRDVNAANHAREALEKAGFNSIIKR